MTDSLKMTFQSEMKPRIQRAHSVVSGCPRDEAAATVAASSGIGMKTILQHRSVVGNKAS